MIKMLTKLTDRTRQSIIPLLLVAAFSLPTITIAQDNNADDVLFVSDSVTDAINIPWVLSGGSDEEDHSSILGAKYRRATDSEDSDPIYHNVTIIRNDYAVTGGPFGEAEGTNLTLLGDLFPYCSVFWSASGPHEPLGLFPDRITNGNFENIAGTHGGGILNVPGDLPNLPGWTVISPIDWNVDFNTPPSNGASSGAGFVDLTVSGQISQVLTTEPGQTYMLSIDRNGDGSIVSLNGSFLLLTAGESSGDWTTYTAMFTAPTAMTSLVISGTPAGLTGVDKVRFAPYPQTPGLGADGGLHIDSDVVANLDYYVRNGGFLFVTGHDALTHPPSAPAVSDGPLVRFLGGDSATAGQEFDPSLSSVATSPTPVTLSTIFGTPAGMTPNGGGENEVDQRHDQDYLSGIDTATTALVTGPGGAYWAVRSPYGDGSDVDDGTADEVDLTDGHIAYVANGRFFYNTGPIDEFGIPIDPLSDGEDPTWRIPPYSTALLNFATNSCALAPAAEEPTADDQSVSTFESTPVVITLTGFDPNGDSLSYASTTPGNGALDTLVGDTVEYTPTTGFTGNDSFTFTVNDGTHTSPPATVSIAVLPTPPLTVDAGPDVSIDEGSGDSFSSAGSFIDPEGCCWTATVDYGAGAGPVPLALTGQTFSLANTYSTVDDSVFVISVTVTSDSDADTDTAIVFINNVPPSADAGPDDSISEGETFISAGSFTDPGTADTHNATADYGDGTTVNLTITGNTFPLQHTYAMAGDYTVTVTVTDDDGGIGVDTAVVTVLENVAPQVAADSATVTVDEGQPASNSGTYSDANGDDVSITASVGSVSKSGTSSGTWAWTYTPLDGPDDSGTVTITADDGEGGVVTTTFDLVVNNVAPSVAANNDPVTVNEGTTATNTGTFSDPGLDVVTISASVGTISQSGTKSGTWSWSFATTDESDGQVVTVTATDSDGDFSTTTFQLNVNNVAPTVAADTDPVKVNEGGTAANTGTFSDSGLDVVTISASVGVISQSGTQSGTWSWSLSTQDGPDDSGTVTITADDGEGGVVTTTFELVVNNVAPSAAADNDPVTVNEGTTATNTGTFSDPGLDVVTISASVGTISQSGTQSGAWSWSFATTDESDGQVVTVTATDSDGDFSTTTFQLNVNNVAPTVAADTDPVTVNEGDTATNTGTFSDPGLDVVTISASVGTVSQSGSQSGTWSWSLGTQDGPDDSQTVTITAMDGDGAFSTTTFDLNVDNVAPSVAADNDPVTAIEGDTATNTGTFSDPGLDVLTISASIGTVSQTGSQNGTWSWSFGTSDGPEDGQPVTITATDSDGALSTTSFTLNVSNVAPSVAADNDPVTAIEGGTAANTGTFSDPGLDVVSISASAGTVSQSGSQSGTWSWSLGTPDGPAAQEITITATDSDGAFSTTTFNLIVLNVAPVAFDDEYDTNEDIDLNVGASTGVLANDVDVPADQLTSTVLTGPSHGTLTLGTDGSFLYEPDLNWNGTDGFTYTVEDEDGDSDVGAVIINVAAVNDPPTLSVDIETQTVQYSDGISPVTITAADVDNVLPAVSLSHLSAALPMGLTLSAGTCAPDNTYPPDTGSSCTWTLSGDIGERAGTYPITFTVDETPGVPGGLTASAGTSITVSQENATVAFYDDNPVAIIVDGDGSDSSLAFTLRALITETEPDLADNGLTAPGDIGNIGSVDVDIVLTPVGPGGPEYPTSCSLTTAATGYAGELTVSCDFAGVPVNTYSVDVTVSGDYYTGSGDDVFTVYDPSLGFTTGGGWFYWPGTDDKTNFGYTMKYGKNGRNVRGSLLLIRHLDDGTKYRLKSNALEGLALGGTETFGWASFSGKATYLEPGWPDPIGNHRFTAYVEDHAEPGTGADRIWIETRDKDGNVLPGLTIGPDATGDAEIIDGGNIVVPHASGGGGGGGKGKKK